MDKIIWNQSLVISLLLQRDVRLGLIFLDCTRTTFNIFDPSLLNEIIERMEWLTHKGKEILYEDYTNLTFIPKNLLIFAADDLVYSTVYKIQTLRLKEDFFIPIKNVISEKLEKMFINHNLPISINRYPNATCKSLVSNPEIIVASFYRLYTF